MVFRRHAFKLKIIGLLLVFTLIPMLLANRIWYRTATESVEKLALEKSESTLQQLSMSIQNFVNGIEISAMNVVCDDEVKEILHSGSTLDVEAYKANQEKLERKLNMAVYNNMTISRISMITDLYHVDSTGEKINIDKFEREDWYQSFKASGKFVDFTEIYKTDYGHGKQEATIAYLQRITRPPTVQMTGVFVVEIRYSKIKKLFRDIVEEGENQLFVLDNDKIIYSPEGYFGASQLSDGQKRLIKDAGELENGENY